VYISGYDYYYGWVVGLKEDGGCIDLSKPTTELAATAEEGRQRAAELNAKKNAR
jgi:hypothetical protein